MIERRFPVLIHSFESVDLYAMVSVYLKKQDFDIGSRIKKGEVLAEINVPRGHKGQDGHHVESSNLQI